MTHETSLFFMVDLSDTFAMIGGEGRASKSWCHNYDIIYEKWLWKLVSPKPSMNIYQVQVPTFINTGAKAAQTQT